MPDVEKVIEGLEMSYKYSNVDENNTLVPQWIVLHAIALLKEYERAIKHQSDHLDALLKAQEPRVLAGAELTDAELIEKIRKAPITLKPAVDAVPIIRCANCKWWNPGTLGVAHRCAALNIATTGEFYCAAAERKSNAYADQSGAEYADNPTV